MVVVVAAEDFPENRPITAEDIIRQVAAKPGFSTGVSYDVLKFVWCTFCEYVEHQLLKSRGVVVPGFAHIQLKSVVSDALLWGTKTVLIPSFVMLPNFVSQHGLRMLKQADPVVKTSRSSVVSFCAIATASGLSKAVVMNGVKDITHRIGLCAGRGWRLNIDCGFCRLLAEERRYNVRWNSAFNGKVADIARRLNNKRILSSTYAGTELYEAADTVVSDVGIDTGTLAGVHRHISDNRKRHHDQRVRRKLMEAMIPDTGLAPTPTPPDGKGRPGRAPGAAYRRPQTARPASRTPTSGSTRSIPTPPPPSGGHRPPPTDRAATDPLGLYLRPASACSEPLIPGSARSLMSKLRGMA
eukprot:TRINITY_DN28425_c0_g1_i1.p1 TRINITY_DN28425_c0_g1~~TRINITY_DN28425_c0_g1_i1.p1  ORF type:complete len:370 (+),score=114.09 TRINITY_DN28425_c0_g1_i1:47-1111(+)